MQGMPKPDVALPGLRPPDVALPGLRPRLRASALVTLVLALVVALTAGCSLISRFTGDEDTGGPLPEPAPLLQQGAQATRNLSSVHLDIEVTGQIKELPIKTLSGELTNKPAVAAKGTANLIVAGSDAEVDFVVIDGTLFAALTPNKWIDFGPAAEIYDVSAILNPDTGLANVLANFIDPKSDGRETIDGVKTIRITGDVTLDAVNKIAPQLGATGPVAGTAWIREDGNHDLVRAKLQPTESNSLQMTLSNWDAPVTVTKPM